MKNASCLGSCLRSCLRKKPLCIKHLCVEETRETSYIVAHTHRDFVFVARTHETHVRYMCKSGNPVSLSPAGKKLNNYKDLGGDKRLFGLSPGCLRAIWPVSAPWNQGGGHA